MPRRIFAAVFLAFIIVGLYQRYKPLPEGLRVSGDPHVVADADVVFLADKTYMDERGVRTSEQQIFDAVISAIDKAERYVLIDMFLFNDLLGTATSSYRGLSQELTDALISAKQDHPDMAIQVITDPINQIYGGYVSPHIVQLRGAGISVVETDLSKLRDSNPIFSGLWRLALQWIPTGVPAYLPNVLDPSKEKLSLRPYLATLNFKANHRKVLVADNAGRELISIVSSANPHDGSSAHSNSGVYIANDLIALDIARSERAVAEFSKAKFIEPPAFEPKAIQGNATLYLYTEGLIKEKIVLFIDEMETGDSLDMSMFYLSDRHVVKALKRADERGAKIRLLLDPNKDAFGRKKDGVPNRQVAHELLANSKGNTEVRWCDTHGEQCHSKLLIFSIAGVDRMLLGSANLTRRNIHDLNLESNVLISGQNVTAIRNARAFFDEQWQNKGGKRYSTEYEAYKNESGLKTLQYLVMEYFGTSSF
ncbi:MAG: phospholipase [Candidatus Pacebacteria bacterium]|nr:phospholipase [Candidatus Paceibacterota bacterium]